MTQIVTVKQLHDYVLAQPDDKPVRNGENDANDECGCVMVQYANDVLKLPKNYACGFNNWNNKGENIEFARIQGGTRIHRIFSLTFTQFCDIKTFGELKDAIGLTLPE